MTRYVIRLLLAAAALAVATAVALPGAAVGARGSCPGFTATVIGSGAKVSQLRVHGMSCGQAHKMAQRWLAGIDHSDGRFLFKCAPPARLPRGRCSIGSYGCAARGISGATAADTVTCSHRREGVSWRADFDQEQGSSS
jgi:hypothetical protein